MHFIQCPFLTGTPMLQEIVMLSHIFLSPSPQLLLQAFTTNTSYHKVFPISILAVTFFLFLWDQGSRLIQFPVPNPNICLNPHHLTFFLISNVTKQVRYHPSTRALEPSHLLPLLKFYPINYLLSVTFSTLFY